MVLYIQVDRETSERCGAGGMFRVISVTDENEKEYSVNCGIHYHNLEQVVRDLGFDPDSVSYEEV